MTALPTLAPPLSRLAGLLPKPPASVALTLLARRIAARHPEIVSRLGSHAGATFALDPTDLPVVMVLTLPGGVPRIRLQKDNAGTDCRISGKLSALFALVHGAVDGDALFFSRDLVIAGDTAAALALRNAIDNAELDIMEELQHLAPPLARALRPVVALLERQTGVALHRASGVN
ncbi:ubiquinone anaerobic biosynthesis accessory factor UbiT [Cereibacter changlensis]|uniref:ubiquinone anaerobic biosynthesis accessory factor UbiT n=1 Tax=Cereibacter changlensis TaxID=402884 RepID=UPI0040347021